MQKKSMYYDVNHTRICRNHYKGNSVVSLFKNVWTVLMFGNSPISHSSRKRRIH